MNKTKHLTIRIDQELNEKIAFLKNRNIRYTDIVREAILESIDKICECYKYKEKREYYPF